MSFLLLLHFAMTFAAAALVSLAGAALARRAALRLRVVAMPGEHRRHARVTPLLGGVGLYAALLLLFLYLHATAVPVGAIAAMTSFFFLLGFCDDLRPLPSLAKLLLQLLAAVLFVWLGFDVSSLPPGLGLWARLAAVFWILAIANGMNFMDGLDGLCTGISFLIGGSLAVLMVWWGQAANPLTFMALGVAGAALGFLKMNLRPAEMFLGDCGSLQLGGLLALIALLVLRQCPAPFWAVAEALGLCFAIPLADCALTVLRRLRLRRPLFSSDWGHLHHRLLDSGFSHAQAVHILWAVQAVLSVLAVVAGVSGPGWTHIWAGAGLLFMGLSYVALRWRERRHGRPCP